MINSVKGCREVEKTKTRYFLWAYSINKMICPRQQMISTRKFFLVVVVTCSVQNIWIVEKFSSTYWMKWTTKFKQILILIVNHYRTNQAPVCFVDLRRSRRHGQWSLAVIWGQVTAPNHALHWRLRRALQWSSRLPWYGDLGDQSLAAGDVWVQTSRHGNSTYTLPVA